MLRANAKSTMTLNRAENLNKKVLKKYKKEEKNKCNIFKP